MCTPYIVALLVNTKMWKDTNVGKLDWQISFAICVFFIRHQH